MMNPAHEAAILMNVEELSYCCECLKDMHADALSICYQCGLGYCRKCSQCACDRLAG